MDLKPKWSKVAKQQIDSITRTQFEKSKVVVATITKTKCEEDSWRIGVA
jgi:hypothetical protein